MNENFGCFELVLHPSNILPLLMARNGIIPVTDNTIGNTVKLDLYCRRFKIYH